MILYDTAEHIINQKKIIFDLCNQDRQFRDVVVKGLQNKC